MRYEKPQINVFEAELTDVIMLSLGFLTTKVGKGASQKTATGIGEVDGTDIYSEGTDTQTE